MGLIARVLSLRGLTGGLREQDLTPDPMDLFASWFRFARTARIFWPDSVALATADADGKPSVRMVLLKAFRGRDFIFYTNYESQKGRELSGNPHASMVMYWNDLVRQVRMTGRVEKLSREDSETYFHRRPRGSQIGAWASHQDQRVESRDALLKRYEDYEKKFAGKPVPLPPYWGGYRLIADEIEFWQGRTYRLHDRFRYTWANGSWTWARLCP